MYVNPLQKLQNRAMRLGVQAKELMGSMPVTTYRIKGEGIAVYLADINLAHVPFPRINSPDMTNRLSRFYNHRRRKYAQRCAHQARALRKLVKHYVYMPGDPNALEKNMK